MNIKEKIETLLAEISPVLETLKDEWFIIGASALILSDVTISDTKDLDLLTSRRDAAYLKTAWKERILDHTPADSDLFRSNFARFHFTTLDLEVLGGFEVNKGGKWIPLTVQEHYRIDYPAFSIKIPSLSEQKRILVFFGRPKDLTRIKLINQKIKGESIKLSSPL